MPHHVRVSLLQRGDELRRHAHRAQRSFLAVNAVPLVAGIMLASYTDLPAAPVYGPLTLGLVGGILQCCLFVATAWLYERRCTRSCDPIEQSLVADLPRNGQSGTRDRTGR
ncbi:DUF485 domain-containing protein [Streptomyces sp. NPDC005374]|uniref:DUF485 domain-containing protein n=1 Tax=Streptomyces sp. NPDC005374 TaxID=3364713 RepID=UPI0036A213E1